MEIYITCSKGDLHVTKYSNFPVSNQILNKTFPLSIISIKSIRNHAVIMYKCSNVEKNRNIQHQ